MRTIFKPERLLLLIVTGVVLAGVFAPLMAVRGQGDELCITNRREIKTIMDEALDFKPPLLDQNNQNISRIVSASSADNFVQIAQDINNDPQRRRFWLGPVDNDTRMLWPIPSTDDYWLAGEAFWHHQLQGTVSNQDHRIMIAKQFEPILNRLCRPTFGNFHFPIPGLGASIDDLVSGGAPLITYINAIMNLIIGLVVVAAVIMIVAAGYMYMTAGGSGQRIAFAKGLLFSAIGGIVLALTAWLVLNTISPQFAGDLQEPKLEQPAQQP